MKSLKFWSILSFITLLFTEYVFYSFYGGAIHLSFPELDVSWLIYLGMYFGLPGMILWIGRQHLVSNRVMWLALGIGVITLLIQQILAPMNSVENILFATVLWAVGGVSLGAFLYHGKTLFRHNVDMFSTRRYCITFSSLAVLLAALGLIRINMLSVTHVLLPETLDVDLYKMDEAFYGFAASLYVIFRDNAHPLWQTLILTVYGLLMMALFLLLGIVMREGRATQLHIFRVLIVPFILAFALYMFNPVAGPPAFGAHYPDDMHWVLEAQRGWVQVVPMVRNGMPSMHFTGAMLLVLVTACLTRKLYFYLACIFAAITFIATMALGEHYLLDLIVAMPFCVALGTALLNPPQWFFYRRRAWWLCAALFVMWELLLHINLTRFVLIDNLWLVRLLALASVAAFAWCLAIFLRAVWRLPAPTAEEWQADLAELDPPPQPGQTSVRWVFGLFICSGFAGLLYEVVFAKHLGVVFGGTSLAAYTVMATYMGGMALGAWLGGLIADRVRLPLRWYALFEGAIGLYALATPMLFKLITHIYVALATDIRPDAAVLTLWRVALGAVVLGIPTILMGTTLPIMFKFLRGYLPERGNIIARLYTANIVGAAFGALVGAYLILPALGLSGATRLAALFSLMIALYALDRLKNLPEKVQPAVETGTDDSANYASLPALDDGQRRRLGIAALLVVSIGGIVTLALEIVNMHMLAIIAGNSVYAFGLMLATFLLGLGLGSASYGKLRRVLTDPAVAAVAQLGIFFSIIISAFQWDGLSGYFASFGFMEAYHHFGFAARELIRGGVCAIIMMPPAFFIGLGYPATMTLASDWLKNRGEAAGLGIASLCNTLGNIAGVLLAGFLFLNWWGSNRLLLALAVLSLLLACYMLYAGRFTFTNRRMRRFATAGVALAVLFALLGYPAQWNLNQIATGANVYFQPSPRGDVIDALESIQGGLITVNHGEYQEEGKAPEQILTLLTNGKFQGNNSREVIAQVGFALTPLLHTSHRDDVLVIGYGTGNSAHVLHQENFARVDIAELAPDMVAMADRHFADINGLVSQQPNVTLYYTDGRNLLLTQNKRYDLISMEINIWFAGAANLYNREFYQLVATRLQEDGVLQQWVQLHHIRPIDLIYVLNTLHQEFRYVWLYVVGGQGVLVATNSAAAAQLHHIDGQLVVDENALTAQEKALQASMVLEPEDVDYLSRTLRLPQNYVSTDNNLYLEYATPKGNAIVDDARQQNIEIFRNLRQERMRLETEASRRTENTPHQP